MLPMCRLLLSGRRLPSNCCETSNRNVLTVIGMEPFLQVCFVTGLSPGGGLQSLLHICCVTGLCIEEELTVGKDYPISCVDSITKYGIRLTKSSTPIHIIAAVLVNVSAGAGRAKLIYTTFRHIFDTRVNAMLHITSVISTAGALVVVTA